MNPEVIGSNPIESTNKNKIMGHYSEEYEEQEKDNYIRDFEDYKKMVLSEIKSLKHSSSGKDLQVLKIIDDVLKNKNEWVGFIKLFTRFKKIL